MIHTFVQDGFSIEFKMPILHRVFVMEYVDGYLVGFRTMLIPEDKVNIDGEKVDINTYIHLMNWLGRMESDKLLTYKLITNEG